MADFLTVKERGALMAKIRSRDNRSTERAVLKALRRAGLGGWRRHWKAPRGRPDFAWRQAKVALFVDGCFWHGCPLCEPLAKRKPGRSARERRKRAYWLAKIRGNRRRDARTDRFLRRRGWSVIRLRECRMRYLTAALEKVRKKLEQPRDKAKSPSAIPSMSGRRRLSTRSARWLTPPSLRRQRPTES